LEVEQLKMVQLPGLKDSDSGLTITNTDKNQEEFTESQARNALFPGTDTDKVPIISDVEEATGGLSGGLQKAKDDILEKASGNNVSDSKNLIDKELANIDIDPTSISRLANSPASEIGRNIGENFTENVFEKATGKELDATGNPEISPTKTLENTGKTVEKTVEEVNKTVENVSKNLPGVPDLTGLKLGLSAIIAAALALGLAFLLAQFNNLIGR